MVGKRGVANERHQRQAIPTDRVGVPVNSVEELVGAGYNVVLVRG